MPALRLRSAVASFAGAFAALVLAGPAAAHVKWFCAFDVSGRPRGLEQVLCDDFEMLMAISLVALLSGAIAESTAYGQAMLRALDVATAFARRHTELLVRGVCAFFLISLWNLGGTILTPELKTESAFVPWFQLFLAACLLWRQTLPIVGLGLVGLFVYGVASYGPFHLADYPIFIGLAAYLALIGVGRNYFGIKPLDLLRYLTAITLMWASVEKWAYPQWSFPLFEAKPSVTLGFDPEFFMRAAGVVEFALAFALLCTPLMRRLSAILLLATFVSAIFEFGKVDAIGHSMIIAALIGFIADDAKRPVRRFHYAGVPAGFAACTCLFIGLYYLAHEAAFGIV
jgi:hypothetical protein